MSNDSGPAEPPKLDDQPLLLHFEDWTTIGQLRKHMRDRKVERVEPWAYTAMATGFAVYAFVTEANFGYSLFAIGIALRWGTVTREKITPAQLAVRDRDAKEIVANVEAEAKRRREAGEQPGGPIDTRHSGGYL